MEHEARNAFLDAYEKLADVIFRRCLFKTSDRDAALELAQETFTRAWDHIARGGSIENYHSFIFTIAENCIKDHYKKHRPTYEGELSERVAETIFDIPSFGDAETQAEYARAVACLKRLSEKHRSAIVLRYTEGFAVQDIAESLGESANTVSVWLKRALESLRTCLGLPKTI